MVTSLAGFAVVFAFPLSERFSGLGLIVASPAASDPVVTSLAGFAGGRRPHAPGGRTAIPGCLQIGTGGFSAYPGFLLDAPQRPSQPSQSYNLLSFLFAQDVAHADEGYSAYVGINVPGVILVGRFSGDHHWPVLSDR